MVFACIAEFDVHFSLVFLKLIFRTPCFLQGWRFVFVQHSRVSGAVVTQDGQLLQGVFEFVFCFCTTLPRFRRSGYPYQSTVPGKVTSGVLFLYNTPAF